MHLLLGSHVREHGHRVGRLAGFELEPAGLKLRRIIFSPDGELGTHAMTRPMSSLDVTHDDGEIELRTDTAAPPMPAASDVVLLSRAVRLRRAGREIGRFVGLCLNPADRSLLEVYGRPHWWSRRLSLPAAGLDCSTPGEIRSGSSGGTQAA
jgi:hypothetical protein